MLEYILLSDLETIAKNRKTETTPDAITLPTVSENAEGDGETESESDEHYISKGWHNSINVTFNYILIYCPTFLFKSHFAKNTYCMFVTG